MAFYKFQLDVPASADIVAARISSAVGKVAGFRETLKRSWRPGPFGTLPFLGNVEGRKFHIFRNTNHNRAFRPQVRGEVVDTPTGSRVSGILYLHPIAVAVMFFRLTIVLLMWWTTFRALGANYQTIYLEAVFFLVLAIHMAGFFAEAARVLPLLSQAAFNPAITAPTVPAPHPLVPENGPTQAEASAWRVAASMGALAVLAIGLAGAELYIYWVRSCPAFSAAINLASRSAQIKAALGEPIRAGTFPRGFIYDGSNAGYAMLAIPISGPAGRGMLYTMANRTGGQWDIEGLRFEPAGTRGTVAGLAATNDPTIRAHGLDLTPMPRRERFQYPVPGRVYILPLDSEAGEEIRDLPAYYKARLDLNITLLPVAELPAATIDGKSKQVVAEKAVLAIQAIHPEIAEDLDAVLLAVTSRDMNIASSGWRFATNLRADRIGIVATARLRAASWLGGSNPTVFPVRVRKLITKNLALMTYPLELSADVTSAVANAAFSSSDFDVMGEELRGENGSAHSISAEEPCVTVSIGPNRKQSVRVDCHDGSLLDSRFESFTNYASIPLLVMSRNDFTFPGYPELPFLRQSRAQDDRSRSFGMGATNSFDTLLIGDSTTFATISLVRPDGQQIRFKRYSSGTSYADAKLAAPSLPGNPFGFSKLAWNGHGWDLLRRDGWTELFPACGPTSTWQQCAMVGIRSNGGAEFKVKRTLAKDMETITAPDGRSVNFTVDAARRITAAQNSSGRTVTYDYDQAGRLSHVHDPARGDEYYQYDALNQLTVVLNEQHQPVLTNAYGPRGELESQTLADGGKIRYVPRFDENRRLIFLQLVLPNGYSIKWNMTAYGLIREFPAGPGTPEAAIQ